MSSLKKCMKENGFSENDFRTFRVSVSAYTYDIGLK